jgi:uncharacterized protein YjdB
MMRGSVTVAIALCCGFAACSGDATGPESVASITISAPSSTLIVGESSQLAATTFDADGAVVRGQTVTWSSSNEAVARVTAGGVVLAVAPGSATITATVGAAVATKEILVKSPAAASVVIEPVVAPVPAATAIQLTATATDASGKVIPNANFTWASSNEQVARVTSTGNVLALSPGPSTISATLDGRTGAITVNVVPGAPAVATLDPDASLLYVGSVRRLGPHFFDANGNVTTAQTMSWASSNPSAVSVSSSGEIQGRALASNVDITVTAGAAVAHSSATVIAIQSIDMGDFHGCFLTVAGKIFCWGTNANGEMGVGGGILNSLNPVAVSPGVTFKALSMGASHSCAISENNTLYCWGDNGQGQVGTGLFSPPVFTPNAVIGNRGFTEVAAGRYHTCGVTTSSEIYCWGNWNIATPTNVQTPTQLHGITAGNYTTCGLDASGKAYCWARNATFDGFGAPVVVDTDVRFTMLSAGTTFTCGLATDKGIYCWGFIPWPVESKPTPIKISGDMQFTSVAAGAAHLCGIGIDGKAYCQGYGGLGELGNSVQQSNAVLSFGPVSPGVSNVSAFESLALGRNTSCGITPTHTPFCWGNGGLIGIGTTSNQFSPVILAPP